MMGVIPRASREPVVVVAASAFCLAHVPDLVQFGSKPSRLSASDPAFRSRLTEALRSDDEAVRYPPNQACIGNRTPDQLAAQPRPWHAQLQAGASRTGPFGEVFDEAAFLAVLERADPLTPPVVALNPAGRRALDERVERHPLLRSWFPAPGRPAVLADGAEPSRDELAVTSQGAFIGVIRRDERAEGADDPNLSASVLLENLAAKASGALALRWLCDRHGIDPERVDFVISCGEEAVGDRYQRGGGGMAKAMAELAGCGRASGMDVKNFCAGPLDALVTAAALVRAGLHRIVMVVGGGSLAKLGMKSEAMVNAGVPVLEDTLASIAVAVTADDGQSPTLLLEPGSVGLAPVGASASDSAIHRCLLVEPLAALGLRLTDVDRYAGELHNAEIMAYAGSGDVAAKTYRSIGAMAVLAGHVPRADLEPFIARIAWPGFAPTQGHIPSGVAALGWATQELRSGAARRALLMAKASIFLGRMTELYDGRSIVVESNPATGSAR
ncbi:MAG: glycine/sarcosine/betaine reductase complex component C subunit beta [Acidimicrobiales bacterium]